MLLEQRTQLSDLRQGARVQEELVRTIDGNTATTQRDLRNDVYEMEKELNARVRELDTTMRTTREELEKRMTEILANPLNTVE